MKHLRTATILIVGILAVSLSAMAQPSETAYYFYRGQDATIELRLREGRSSREVGGSYEFNGKQCEILGSYFPATGRLKARCQNKDGYLDVTSTRLTKQSGFQLTIGNYTYAVLMGFNLAGTWQIEQRGSISSYDGKLYLHDVPAENRLENDPDFYGTAVWSHHQQGTVEGRIESANGVDYVTFTIDYPDGLKGYYKGRLGSERVDMVDGTARGSSGGPTVSWTAKRVSAVERVVIPQKMEETEGAYSATWTLLPSGYQFQAKWSNGAEAILRIEKFDSEGVRIVRGDTSASVSQNFTAVYTGRVSGNRIEGDVQFTQNGRSWPGKWSATW